MSTSVNNSNYETTLPTQSTSITAGTIPSGVKDIKSELSTFFSRPILLSSGTLDPSSYYTLTFVDKFFNNSAVINKLKYFAFVRGTFVLTLTISVNPVSAGCVLFANKYTPLAATTPTPENDRLAYAHLFTCDHLLLDASTPTGTMRIPWAGRYNDLPVATTQPSYFLNQRVLFGPIVPFYSTLDGTPQAVSYKLECAFEEFQITTPTVWGSNAVYTSEITEASSKGFISGPATVVENVAESLADVPILGPFAKATSLAAGAVSSIATLFGFSRPPNISAPPYPHAEDYASFIGPLRVKTITVDPQQEVSLDGNTFGDNKDNLALWPIISRPGICYWNQHTLTGATGTSFMELLVTPNVAISDLQWSAAAKTQFSLPPLSYVAQMFCLWRGTIKYTIRIPASNMCRGKLRFFFNPYQMTNTTILSKYSDIIQSAASVVIDLAHSVETTIEIPYTSIRPYQGVSTPFDTTTSIGYLYGVIDEPVYQPATTFNYTVLIAISACEDFRFNIPNQANLQAWKRQSYNAAYNTTTTTINDLSEVAYSTFSSGLSNSPYSGAFASYTASYAEAQSTNADLLEPFVDSVVPKYQMGEDFLSLRPFLKRFYPYQTLIADHGGNPYGTMWFVPYLLNEQLFTSTTPPTVLPILMHPVRWVSNLFVGIRGSMRYKLRNELNVTACRNFLAPNQIYEVTTPLQSAWFSSWTSTGEAEALVEVGETAMFQLPFQGNSNFIPTSQNDFPHYATQYGLSIVTKDANETFSQGDTVFASIGEDFNPVLWNGVPLLMYQFPHP